MRLCSALAAGFVALRLRLRWAIRSCAALLCCAADPDSRAPLCAPPLPPALLRPQVLPKLVTVGLFDGAHPSLACATSSDNLLLHSPHRRSGGGGAGGAELETRTLNLNRTISALAAGDLEQKADNKRDILLIGSSTSLQGYDVESNSDVFFKEVADGVNALAFGSLASHPAPMAMVGGNCSLQGFNASGNEVFWTVTGDNVSALTFRDTKEGKQEVRNAPLPKRTARANRRIARVASGHAGTASRTNELSLTRFRQSKQRTWMTDSAPNQRA